MDTLAPRQKLLAALAVFGTTLLVATAVRLAGAAGARAALATLAVAALAWFASRARRARATFSLPPRLQLVQRVGLDQKSAVALVELDGQPFLVVHGPGYATVRPARRPPLPAP